jgi:hypothetical protein
MSPKIFKGKTVVLDGKQFVDVTFDSCTLVYKGSKGVTLKGCRFIKPQFVFDGPASNTLVFLHEIYHGGFSEIVEATLREIMNDPASRGTRH